jgi:hypothetical protein
MNNEQFTFAVGEIKWLKTKKVLMREFGVGGQFHRRGLLHQGAWGCLRSKLPRKRKQLSYCE